MHEPPQSLLTAQIDKRAQNRCHPTMSAIFDKYAFPLVTRDAAKIILLCGMIPWLYISIAQPFL